ncbi:hypothetical protein NDU88_003749 [Pleurodeles waltl]|uniref:Uncharacterized protein n=1 Tax=Pleurodeles waltl TaxID=8319 RepID=A0AAV7SGV5_PLEWA|nr:hypothetical protein NDU88_003749 [Pleurodeles waltl]
MRYVEQLGKGRGLRSTQLFREVRRFETNGGNGTPHAPHSRRKSVFCDKRLLLGEDTPVPEGFPGHFHHQHHHLHLVAVVHCLNESRREYLGVCKYVSESNKKISSVSELSADVKTQAGSIGFGAKGRVGHCTVVGVGEAKLRKGAGLGLKSSGTVTTGDATQLKATSDLGGQIRGRGIQWHSKYSVKGRFAFFEFLQLYGWLR